MLLELDNVWFRSLRGLSLRMESANNPLAIQASSMAQARDLAAICVGQSAPRSGQAWTLGASAYDSPATRARLGTLLFDELVDVSMSVRRYVSIALSQLGSDGSVDDILSRYGYASWADRRTNELSHGERRTIALVIALSATRIELAVLCHPLSCALPVNVVQQALFEKVRNNVGVVLIGVDRNELRAFVSKLLFVSDGKVIGTAAAASVPQLLNAQPPVLEVESPDASRLGRLLMEDSGCGAVAISVDGTRVTLRCAEGALERLSLALLGTAASNQLRIASIQTRPNSSAAPTAQSQGVAP